jgi:hypothetical protein
LVFYAPPNFLFIFSCQGPVEVSSRLLSYRAVQSMLLLSRVIITGIYAS